MKRNIKDYHFQTNRPTHTKLYNTMKSVNIPLLVKYLITIIDDENNKNRNDISFKSTELYQLFNAFVSFGNFDFKVTLTKFGMDIKEYEGCISKEKRRDGNYYVINIEKLKEYLIQKKLYFDDFI